MDSTAAPAEATRRSTRIRAQIPIQIVSLAPGVAFSEHCHTLVVNTEGCGVRLTRALEPGTPLSLEELPCGKSVRARVANCVPLGTGSRYWLVGIALERQENVWCIQPTPANWGSEPQPSVVPEPPAEKSRQWPYSFFSKK